MFRAVVFLVLAAIGLSACGRVVQPDLPTVTSVYVLKSQRQLLLLNGNEIVKSYDFEMGFAPEGHKQFEGDGKTPEGVYYIDRRNPNSQFHLSLGISYPNRADYAYAQSQGRLPGGDIFIHGTPRDQLGEDFYPFEAAGLDASLIITLYGTQKTGKPLIDPATNEIMWTKEELVDAIEMYQAMVDNHVIESWRDRAAAGNVALHENPRWSRGEIAGTYQWDSTYFKISDPLDEGQEIVYTGILSQDGQQTEGIYRKSSMVFSISANSEHQQAAAEVLNCLLNEPEGVAAMATARGVPSSSAAKALLSDAGAIKPEQTAAQQLVLDAEGPAIHPFMEHPDVRSAMTDNLELFAYGEIDAETAADDMLYGIEEALADIK